MGYYYRGFDLNNPSDIHPDDIARTQRIVQADGGNPDDFVQVLNVLNFGSHLGRRPDGSFSNPPFVARVRMADGYRRPPEPTPEQQNNPTPAGSPPPNTATAPSPQAPAPAPAAPTGALSRPAATQSPQGTNAGGPTGPIGPIDSGTGSSGVSITAARIAEDFGLEDLGDGMYSLGPAGGSVTGEALLRMHADGSLGPAPQDDAPPQAGESDTTDYRSQGASKTDTEWVDFVSRFRSYGHSDDDIRRQLVEMGFDPVDVERGFKSDNQNVTDPPPPTDPPRSSSTKPGGTEARDSSGHWTPPDDYADDASGGDDGSGGDDWSWRERSPTTRTGAGGTGGPSSNLNNTGFVNDDALYPTTNELGQNNMNQTNEQAMTADEVAQKYGLASLGDGNYQLPQGGSVSGQYLLELYADGSLTLPGGAPQNENVFRPSGPSGVGSGTGVGTGGGGAPGLDLGLGGAAGDASGNAGDPGKDEAPLPVPPSVSGAFRTTGTEGIGDGGGPSTGTAGLQSNVQALAKQFTKSSATGQAKKAREASIRSEAQRQRETVQRMAGLSGEGGSGRSIRLLGTVGAEEQRQLGELEGQLQQERLGGIAAISGAQARQATEDVSRFTAEQRANIETFRANLDQQAQAFGQNVTEAEVTGVINSFSLDQVNAFQGAMNSKAGDANFDQSYDFNGDGEVTVKDWNEMSRIGQGTAAYTLQGQKVQRELAESRFQEKVMESGITGMFDGQRTVQESQRKFNNMITDANTFLDVMPVSTSGAEFDEAFNSRAGDDNYRRDFDWDDNGVIDFNDWSQITNSDDFEVIGDPSSPQSAWMFRKPGKVSKLSAETGIEEDKIRAAARSVDKEFKQRAQQFMTQVTGYVFDENGEPVETVQALKTAPIGMEVGLLDRDGNEYERGTVLSINDVLDADGKKVGDEITFATVSGRTIKIGGERVSRFAVPNLDRLNFDEARRQFNEALEGQMDRFAESLGLSREELAAKLEGDKAEAWANIISAGMGAVGQIATNKDMGTFGKFMGFATTAATVASLFPSDKNIKTDIFPLKIVSDVNTKTDVEDIKTGKDVLDRLDDMPVSTWRYKSEPKGIRHLGPMAQDFKKAFNLGSDDKAIAVVDGVGVTMAATKQLNSEFKKQKKKLSALERKISANSKRRKK